MSGVWTVVDTVGRVFEGRAQVLLVTPTIDNKYRDGKLYFNE